MIKPRLEFPHLVWQILLMGLLGLSGVIFVPVLLHWADPKLTSVVLVAQVYVYFLVVLVQYGFVLSGPAAVARASNPVDAAKLWHDSVQGKLRLMGPVTVVFGVVYVFTAKGQWYVWVFVALLWAYALNSNWWLQAQQCFAPAVGFAALGVMLSASVVFALVEGYVGNALAEQGVLMVLVLILPQVCVGGGTWWVARCMCEEVTVAANSDVGHKSTGTTAFLRMLRSDAPLVASQLLLLASSTLGTGVVGSLADVDNTAAYAATEKLFNLAATVLVGLYMALYPRLADLFYADRGLYWRAIFRLLLVCLCLGAGLSVLFACSGSVLLSWYMPPHMLAMVAPALQPFGLWVGVCISQHVLTSYLVLVEQKSWILWANASVLLVTIGGGYACALAEPTAWVYGMLAGQGWALVLLLSMRHQDAMLNS